MQSRDSKKNPKTKQADTAEAEAAPLNTALEEGALQTPEVPDISIFGDLDDDGEWYEDGDPTQEVEDQDIMAEEFVLVDEDGAPLPADEAEPSEMNADLPPQQNELQAEQRVARLPAPDRETEAKAADDAAPETPEGKGKAKGKGKGKGKGKAKGKGKGKGKAQGKATGKTKGKAKAKAADRPQPAAESGSHLERGLALREEGQPQRAVEALIKALAQGERAVDCHTIIGQCYMELGIVDKAVSSFKNALFAEEVTAAESTALYYELGRTQERLEAWEEALYYFRRVLKSDPELKDTVVRVEKIEQLLAD